VPLDAGLDFATGKKTVTLSLDSARMLAMSLTAMPIERGEIAARRVGGSARQIARVALAALVTSCALLGAPIATAFAQPCPDVEVLFARGTSEPPGVGGVGQAFVDALRPQVGARSLDVYPVNYQASGDFSDRIQFAQSVVDGIKDAGGHIESTAANCPKTRIVLGGYSQGAAVAGFVTSAVIPAGVPAEYASYLPKPMPPEVANHVAAVTLFGKPSAQWLQSYGAPAIVIGPAYASKTIELCAPGDSICNGDTGGGPSFAHAAYPVNGMAGQAADFAASHL
jgi:cutinase-like protein